MEKSLFLMINYLDVNDNTRFSGPRPHPPALVGSGGNPAMQGQIRREKAGWRGVGRINFQSAMDEYAMATIRKWSCLHGSGPFLGYLRCSACLLALIVLTGCSAARKQPDNGEYVVRIPYEYGTADKSERAWRALLTAEDACHRQGYQDADIVGQPTVCKESGSAGCSRFAAVAAYACIGMNYQVD